MVSQRTALVGVIGGEDRTGCARLLGQELAKSGCALLTGGCPSGSPTLTKNAAILGALDADRTARFIGVMPNASHGHSIIECLSPTQMIIHSGLSSLDRDPINGTTPDVLICFDGGKGTICELAFGILVGRQAVFHGHCARNLLEKCTKHSRNELKTILSVLAGKWQAALQLTTVDGEAILNTVTDYLRQATERTPLSSAAELAQAALRLLPDRLPESPTFAGVLDPNHDRQHRRDFAAAWKNLSAKPSA